MISSAIPISPALLHAAAVLLVGSATALVGLHTGMLAYAGGRTSLSARARVLAPLLAALALGWWLGWALVVAQQRALVGPASSAGLPQTTLPTLLAIVAAIAIGTSFLLSRTVRALNAATPPAWLVGIQVYRTAGAMFLWPFLAHGVMPAGFAVPAGIGDALTGLTAPFVALALAQNRPGAYRLAVAWNWFGLLDLVVAPAAAVITGTQIAAIYPLGLIPIFLGPPLGILTHIYSLRNLAANRAAFEPGPPGARSRLRGSDANPEPAGRPSPAHGLGQLRLE